MNFGQIQGSQFIKPAPINISKNTSWELFQALNKLNGGLKLAQPLSKRELQCLILILEGKPASAIAQELIITTRTAEHHIDHIKTKLGCSTKMEIFAFAATLKDCGGELSFLRYSWE